MTGWKRRSIVLSLMAALAVAPACTRVVNPATGQTELTAMSPAQERQVGSQQHPQVMAQFGGAYQDPGLQAYVSGIGERLATVSELPDLDFTFTLLNSDMVNAFALPGGYVYVTRGLLALADNEAELAGVIAHEIGHVTARHSAQRYSRGVVAQGGVAIGSIVAGILGGGAAAQAVQQAGGVGAQAYLAGYSRDQEFQADELGVRYLARAGYDPAAMSSFLEKLGENDALARRLAGREDAPDPASSWFATHPRTPDRVLRAVEQASAATPEGRIDRERYLAAIDGMIYGEDPRQGFVRDGRFVHPELRFAFAVPPGFRLTNTPAAVIGQSPDGLMRFDGARVPQNRAMTDYVARDWARELGSEGLRDVTAFEIGGLAAASTTAVGRLDDGRAVSIALAAIRADGDRVYRFMFVSPGRLTPTQARAYESTVDSFRRLGAQQAAAMRPLRIAIVTVEPGQGVDALARRMAVDALPREQFEVLNGLEPGQPLAPGEQVKLIVQ